MAAFAIFSVASFAESKLLNAFRMVSKLTVIDSGVVHVQRFDLLLQEGHLELRDLDSRASLLVLTLVVVLHLLVFSNVRLARFVMVYDDEVDGVVGASGSSASGIGEGGCAPLLNMRSSSISNAALEGSRCRFLDSGGALSLFPGTLKSRKLFGRSVNLVLRRGGPVGGFLAL